MKTKSVHTGVICHGNINKILIFKHILILHHDLQRIYLVRNIQLFIQQHNMMEWSATNCTWLVAEPCITIEKKYTGWEDDVHVYSIMKDFPHTITKSTEKVDKNKNIYTGSRLQRAPGFRVHFFASKSSTEKLDSLVRMSTHFISSFFYISLTRCKGDPV